MRRIRAAAYVLAALATVATGRAAAAPTPATADNHIVVADGHVDIGPRVTGNGWEVQLRDDTGPSPVWRATEDVVLHVPSASTVPVPDSEEFDFLGEAGSMLWLLPQVQQPGMPWPGWNTEDPTVAEEVAGDVIWWLESVRGPGTFTLFITGNFGQPERLFDSAEPFPQKLTVPVPTHTHGNWTFSEPGSYQLDIAMTASRPDGAELRDVSTVRVFVGDGEPSSAFAEPLGTSASDSADDDNSASTVAMAAGAAALALAAVVGLARRRRRGSTQ